MTLTDTDIRPESRYGLKRLPVRDSEMAYIDAGEGPPIVFIHGNPTSSFLWRNVIPHLEDLGRCLAPDLIGMGDSGTMPSGTYRYQEHTDYLDTWFEGVGATEDVILVLHDWGGAFGYNRAARFPDQIAGIAYMETMVRPRRWSDLPDGRDKIFRKFRTAEGERMVTEDNFFLETMMFEMGIVRDLSAAEKAVYRTPYQDKERRFVTLQWPREIPFDGDPADNAEVVQRYSDFLAQSDIPKLFVNTTQGHALTGPPREFCRTWRNQTEVTIDARHFLQEDKPHELGRALRAFVQTVRGG